MAWPESRALLRAAFDAAVAAVHPDACLSRRLPLEAPDLVLGAGKAAATMAAAAERHYGRGLPGLVVTRYGHSAPTREIEVIESGHPLPDEAGAVAASRLAALAGSAREGHTVLVLLSGGASALMSLPVSPVPMGDYRSLMTSLLHSGAPIGEVNAVRKHLSQLAGGRLAAHLFPACCRTVAISDVPGDEPSVIASGPTVADPTTLADARRILAARGVFVPPVVAAALQDEKNETPKPGDARLARSSFALAATQADALRAAAAVLSQAGFRIENLGTSLTGEASALARQHAEIARTMLAREERTAILSGGEAEVSGPAGPSGGANREYALALAAALDGAPDMFALAADTDGIDGADDAAGAFVFPDTLARMRLKGIDPSSALARHDSGSAFAAIGEALVTGPTRTNVADFRAILVGAPPIWKVS